MSNNKLKVEINFTDSPNFLMYCTSVILQIVSFVFLFKYKSLEYVIFIYSFILYAFSPLFLVDKIMENMSISPITIYKQICLFVSYGFVTAGLFIVLLTNEKARKIYEDESRTKETSATKYYKKSILTLFAIILPITWCLLGDSIFLREYAEGIKFVLPTRGAFDYIGTFFNLSSIFNSVYVTLVVGSGIVITVASLVLFVKSHKNYKIMARKQKADKQKTDV